MNVLPIVRGQSESWPITIYQDDGVTPVNLVGYSVFIVPDGVDIAGTIAVTNAAGGVVTMSMTPAQTDVIVYRQRFRIKTDSGGGEIKFYPNTPDWLWLVPQ